MKILEKATLKDGTKIQLEHWEEYSEYIIGAYPIAQKAAGFITNGKPFRLTIAENEYKHYLAENVKADYKALTEGRKQLADLREYFHNGEKDAYILGLNTTYRP